MSTPFLIRHALFTASCVVALLAGASMRAGVAASRENAVPQAQPAYPTTDQTESKEDGKQSAETGKDALQKNLGEHYGLLQANLITTMERELHAAGSAGYRVVNAGAFGPVAGYFFGLSGVSGQAVAFLLEKSEPSEKYEYRIWGEGGSIGWSSAGNRLAQKLQNKLNEAATAGFHLLPSCTFGREATLFLGNGQHNLICMERRGSLLTQRYEYQVVHDGGLKKLHEKSELLLQQGYTVVAFDELGANFAILERLADRSSRSSTTPNHAQPYLVLTTNRVSAMQKDLNEKARAGYRLRDVCFSPNGHQVILQQESNPAGAYEYETISFGDKEFEQKIEENGKRGFHMYPRTLGTDLIMEKEPGSDSQYHYVFAAGKTPQDVFAKIDEEKQQGFKLLGLVGAGILLEQTTPAGDHAAPPASQ